MIQEPMDITAGWRLFSRYLLPQRGAALLMAVLLLTSIGLQLAAPQITRGFIDAIGSGAAVAQLITLALAFIGTAFTQQVFKVLAEYWSERVAWSATNALRADLTAHLLGLDMRFHKERTPGELIERVDGDIQALAGFFSSFVVQLVGSALLIVGMVVAVALIDWRLGLAFVVFAIGSMALLTLVRRVASRRWQAEREAFATTFGYMGEIIAAAEDLRSSRAVPYALRRLTEHLRRWQPLNARAELWGSTIWVAAAALVGAGTVLAYALGGSLFLNGAISLGAVYLLVAYTAMLSEPLEMIRTQLQDFQRADASMIRIRELFNIRSQLSDGAGELPDGPLAVAFSNVHFGYEAGNNTINSVTFELAPGCTLGLIGRTGSGKSTLARLLFRQYDADSGMVQVAGMNIRDLRLASLRARVGLVTQDVQIFEASLRDNITFFDQSVADARLLELLELLGLGDWIRRLPAGLATPIATNALSAGEAQLIALARVFIKNPGLVILDEASSRLDPATEALLEQALDRLLAGRTTIIIAHRLQTIARADDILLLEDGHVLEYGPRIALAENEQSRFAALLQTSAVEVLA